MNRMATTHLNILRIEILLSIGLVPWIVSTEAKSQELIEFNNGEVANAEDINANFQSLNAQIAEKSEKMNLYSEGDFVGELMPELDPFRGDVFQGSVFKTPGDYLLPLAVRFDNAFTTRRAGQDKIWFTEPLCAGEAYIRTPFYIPKSASYQGILDYDPTFGWYMAPFSNYVSEGITALSNAIINDNYDGYCINLGSGASVATPLLRIVPNDETVTGLILPEGERPRLTNIELKYE